MAVDSTVLPYLPGNIDHPKRKAKQLHKEFPGLSLSRAQNLTARAMGYADWHALAKAVAARIGCPEFDEDLNPRTVYLRTRCQLLALYDAPSPGPLQTIEFLRRWRLTAMPVSSTQGDEAASGHDRLDRFPRRKWFAGDIVLAPPDITFPVTRKDLDSGNFRKFAQTAHDHPAYCKTRFEDFQENLARAFGFAGLTELERNAVSANLEDAFLPERYVDVIDVLTWRMYLQGTGPLCRGLEALFRASEKCHLELKSRFESNEYPKRLTRWRGLNVPETELSWENQPDFRLALSSNGVMYYQDHLTDAARAVEAYWTPDCGKTLEAIKAECLRDALIPLDDFLNQWGVQYCPAGVEPVTYCLPENRIVGHGFRCNPAGAYLNVVYPDEGEIFIEAIRSLWLNKPVPKGLSFESLPASMLIIPFTGGLNFGRPEIYRTEYGGEREQPDIHSRQAREITPVEVTASGLNFEVEVTLFGNRWRRPVNTFSTAPIAGVLGFEPAKPREPFWIQRLKPFAIDAKSCSAIASIVHACDAYTIQEGTVLATPDGERQYCKLIRMIFEKHPVFIGKPRKGRYGEELFLDLEAEIVVKRWPQLEELPEKALPWLLSAHWTKNARISEELQKDRAPLFLVHTVCAALGIPVTHSDMLVRPFVFITISRLFRLAVQQSPEAVKPADVSVFASQAVKLYRELTRVVEFEQEADGYDTEEFLLTVEGEIHPYINVGR